MLEGQINFDNRVLRKLHARVHQNEKTKTKQGTSQTIQPEEINQKILAKKRTKDTRTETSNKNK